MKMRFKFAGSMAAVAAAMSFAVAAPCLAATAGDVFAAHKAEIATNRCVAVGGYVFGVGRALSKNGGDSVGFSKARLLALGKIVDMAKAHAPWPDSATPELRDVAWRIAVSGGEFSLSINGCETILERREAPEHYMAVVAVPEGVFKAALPDRATLARTLVAVAAEPGKTPAPESSATAAETPEEYEPRGYWEEGGVKINETMAEGQF